MVKIKILLKESQSHVLKGIREVFDNDKILKNKMEILSLAYFNHLFTRKNASEISLLKQT
jgi:hypothetical protein